MKRDWRAYLTIFGGFTWNLVAGSIYCTGSIAPYVASYCGVTSKSA